jgi:ADP-ribose pyrophosphatase YjhB (NUDIX family)
MAWRIPAGDNRRRATCPRCGAIDYVNPKVIVACALHRDDRILWMRRTTAPYAGCWAIPSGFVESGETVRQAACREVLEETHLLIRPEQLLLQGVLSLPDLDQIYVLLTAALPSRAYRPSAEASEFDLLTYDEILPLDLGYPPETLGLFRTLYEATARNELPRAERRMWDMHGRDPAAQQTRAGKAG